jgi:magnesium transporter
MFRILDVAGDGKCEARDVSSLESVGSAGVGQWRWIDCTGASTADLALLQERFAFHPVTIEDCATYDPRPKFEPYDDYLFIVIHALRPSAEQPQTLEARELHAFLGANYVVTVHDEPLDCMEQSWRRLTFEPTLAKRGPAYAYYMLADVALSALFPWIEQLLERIENIEDAMFDAPSPSSIAEAYQLRRLLTSIRRVLSPQREVFSAIVKFDSPLLGKKITPFFRSIYDDAIRLTELVEAARDHIANLREAYSSALSQRNNAVMQRLTVLSAIFLPLTFVTGFFGQNFAALPFDSRLLFYGALSVTVLLPVVMLIWFRSRNWW